jgi:hypothetical protein
VRCASTGAERREGGLCADPACVVTPQARQDTAAEASCRAHARRLSGKQVVANTLEGAGLVPKYLLPFRVLYLAPWSSSCGTCHCGFAGGRAVTVTSACNNRSAHRRSCV